jgi:KaiC/GvpD/RAD55 family RecA-like ATPase
MSEVRPDSASVRAPLSPPKVSTGIAGLDEVLRGGLPSGHMYLVTGKAGAGKTTLALHFLLAGRDRGERGLYSMPDEQLLRLHLHELLGYLNSSNVTTFLIVNQPDAVAAQLDGELDVSYLADTVILYRNYEYRGEVRRALSVLKHRGTSLERTLRELTVTGEGIVIGEALTDFRGVLTGMPLLDDWHERRER